MNTIFSGVMLDLETLGTKPYSVITSIGAVWFAGDEIISEFYMRVKPQSCVDVGLQLDTSTVLWWMRQNDEARLEFSKPSVGLRSVLDSFCRWLPADVCVWGDGATFDNVLLSCAFEKAGIERPWRYSKDRCYRTIKNMFPDIVEGNEGVEHHALSDARNQAIHLIKIGEKLSSALSL